MSYAAGKISAQRCVVTRDYEAVIPETQLSVSENEVLVVVERHFKGWYKVRQTA
jgi:hypothetical protein